MKCPKCGHTIKAKDVAIALGSLTSDKKAAAARENGKKGGRPRKKPDQPTPKNPTRHTKGKKER